MSYKTKAPVVFFPFRRVAQAEMVLRAVRRCRPGKLYVFFDGPVPGEHMKCARVRSNVLRLLDWPCKAVIVQHPTNRGPRKHIVSSLGYVFSQEKSAIILEDDCLPAVQFFEFCDALLHRYSEDERVHMIAGIGLRRPRKQCDTSYSFVHRSSVWGWATWRRAWSHYTDDDTKISNEIKHSNWAWLNEVASSERGRKYYEGLFLRRLAPESQSWDVYWDYARMKQRGLVATPNGNLVRYIGYGPDALSSTDSSRDPRMSLVDVRYPLVHPARVEVDERLQRAMETVSMSPLCKPLKNPLRKGASYPCA